MSSAVVATLATAAACGVLSPLVVARRWSFVGEGLGHSGFGGAGTAWLLALWLPAFDDPRVPPLCAAGFTLLTAVGLAWATRRGRIANDAATGIFLVGTVAWGFLGQHAYRRAMGREPAGFSTLLFGSAGALGTGHAVAAACVLTLVVGCVVVARRELVAYGFDPELAEASGVRVGVVHYGLLALLGVVVVIALQVVGTLLVTALLVLPAVIAGSVVRGVGATVTASVVAALVGAGVGLGASRASALLPLGPAIVLALVAMFVASRAIRRTA